MQANVVALIRDLMKTQRMSVRKISAQIAKESGGSALGYTQQINRILNDPEYDPNFSTVQKILAALNYSFWQTVKPVEEVHSPDLNGIQVQMHQLSQEVTEMRSTLQEVQKAIATLTYLSEHLLQHVSITNNHSLQTDD